MTARRNVVIDSTAPVWAKHLETDLNGALSGLGTDIQGASDAAAAAKSAADAAAGNAVVASRLPTGAVVSSAYAEYTANADLTVFIPSDNTIPQSTEGTQVLSASITPSSVSNKVRVRFQGYVSAAAADSATAALFNGGANAIAATSSTIPGAAYRQPITLEYEHIPASISAQTYTIRVGGTASTLRMNGSNVSQLFGGVSRATLVLEEIKA